MEQNINVQNVRRQPEQSSAGDRAVPSLQPPDSSPSFRVGSFSLKRMVEKKKKETASVWIGCLMESILVSAEQRSCGVSMEHVGIAEPWSWGAWWQQKRVLQ